MLYFKTFLRMNDGERKTMIILTAKVIQTIRAKLDMPKNHILYKDKSINMAEVQTLNTKGYFTDAFDGLALWITRNGVLALALKNRSLGTGTTQQVRDARADVKKSLDLFLQYLNELIKEDQDNAEEIIHTALCVLVKLYKRAIKDFEIKQGPGAGSIILISAAAMIDGKRVAALYRWQWGVMIDGKIVWYDLDSTPKHRTIAINMPLETAVFFRKAVTTTKGGAGKFCKEKCITPK